MISVRQHIDNEQDYKQLCKIVYERNIISKKRNCIRSKLYRALKAHRDISHNREISQHETRISTSLNKLSKLNSALEKTKKLTRMRSSEIKLNSIMVEERDAHKKSIEYAEHKLRTLLKKREITRKFKKMSSNELQMEIAILERDLAQIKIDQYSFTKRTTKTLRNVLKKYNLRLHRSMQNKIMSVSACEHSCDNWESISSKSLELEQDAVTFILEEELLYGETNV